MVYGGRIQNRVGNPLIISGYFLVLDEIQYLCSPLTSNPQLRA